MLAVLVIIEVVADKVPVVDHVNDAIQTFIRPTAGAILFAASAKSITAVHPVLSLICGLLVAGSVHAAKSVVARPVVGVATAGVGTPVVSTLEDVFAAVVSVLAVVVPILMVMIVFLTVWLVASIANRRRQSRAGESSG